MIKYYIPHRCPVCNGTMIVSAGFYDSTSGYITTNAVNEPCRSCAHTGIVWSEYEYPSEIPITPFDTDVSKFKIIDIQKMFNNVL